MIENNRMDVNFYFDSFYLHLTRINCAIFESSWIKEICWKIDFLAHTSRKSDILNPVYTDAHNKIMLAEM